MITTSNLADLKPKGKARYHAAKKVKIVHNGKKYTLDSKREYDVYKELRLREQIGDISGSVIHKRFELVASNRDFRKVEYESDFSYMDKSTGITIVIDVKGQKLNKKTGKLKWLKMDSFKLKEKLFRAKFGFCIRLVK